MASALCCVPDINAVSAGGYRQCKVANKDNASLRGMLRLVDYWMTHALFLRISSAAQELISALRPADLPEFEAGPTCCLPHLPCSMDKLLGSTQAHSSEADSVSY